VTLWSFGDEGRLADVAEILVGGLGEGEPVMPVAGGVLYALEFGNELLGFLGRSCKFGRVASALAEDAVLVEHGFGERFGGGVKGVAAFAGRQPKDRGRLPD